MSPKSKFSGLVFKKFFLRMTQDIYKVINILCFALSIGLLMDKLVKDSSTAFIS